MAKLDLKKQMKALYDAPKEPVLVQVPKLQYIMIDGEGNPNTSEEFKAAVQALFSTSYTLKFSLKKAGQDGDYAVMPLQGLWWTEDMAEFSVLNKDVWKWTLMILQPDHITEELFKQAVDEVERKKKIASARRLRFETFEEGLCAQIMHLGPYSAEEPTIEKLHKFIDESGYELSGKHHEIYLKDFTKCAPEKLKTIIRQPVKKLK
ncbi:MAG: GyrI-like domain-containing protein [Clostridia bacterium]|nr:GyrI-like domain-containing protein [Clostridia bacterium]